MSYAVGNLHTHRTHRVVLHGGVYSCAICGAMSSNELVKLGRPCCRPTSHGNYNCYAYQKHTELRGFPYWPYDSVHMMELS